MNVLHLIKLIINLISPNRFKVGGAAILPTLNKNHHKPILGIKFNKPLLTKRLRLPTRSYTILAKQNNPEEHNPCPTITTTAPISPHHLKIIKPHSTILI